MESKPRSVSTAIGAFFNMCERIVLFALSLSVGVVNLLIGLAVAAHLGIIPKTTADRVLRITSRATAFVTKVLDSPDHSLAKHKAKP